MFRYVSWLYLKSFFLIAFSLSFLFAGLDYLQNVERLHGFNIKVLYLFYKSAYAFDLLFPLALVFGMILAKVTLIRSNALLSFYALGFSKKKVLAPFFTVSLLLTLGYVGLHTTSFVDADIQAKHLMEGKKGVAVKKDLFVKYDESFVYIGRLIPERQEARDLRLYQMKKGRLVRIVYGKRATFREDHWTIDDAKIVTLPAVERLGAYGFRVSHAKGYETLQGFKPKILTSVFEGRRYYTIQAAYEAFRLLLSQHLDTQKVRNLFYHMAVTPFFAIALVIIFFLAIPPYARSFNLFFVSFVLSGATLFVWGVLYLMFRIGRSGIVIPELGSVTIVSLLIVAAAIQFVRRSERI